MPRCFETRLSPAWVASVIGTVAASVWLGLFAFKHVDYSSDLWWQFELRSDASRFLRASVGAAIVLLLFGFSRLIRLARHEAAPPGDADLRDAETAIAAGTSTFPNLVFLEDKAVLFDGDRRAFVMYAVQGRTWVALGDPVGPDDRLSTVIRLFLERCDDFGGVPVFYEVTPPHLHRYADFGLTFVKLGEEAKVDLTHVHPRRRAPREIPPGAAQAGQGWRGVPDRRSGGCAGDPGRASSRVRRLAGGEGRRGERVFARVLPRSLLVAVLHRGHRARGSHPGVCEHLAGSAALRALRGPDAPSPRRAERRHGGAVRAPDTVGQGAGLPALLAGDGPAVGVRAIAGRSVLEPDRHVSVRARRIHLQLPGPP